MDGNVFKFLLVILQCLFLCKGGASLSSTFGNNFCKRMHCFLTKCKCCRHCRVPITFIEFMSLIDLPLNYFQLNCNCPFRLFLIFANVADLVYQHAWWFLIFYKLYNLCCKLKIRNILNTFDANNSSSWFTRCIFYHSWSFNGLMCDILISDFQFECIQR